MLLACVFVGATTETKMSKWKQLFGDKGAYFAGSLGMRDLALDEVVIVNVLEIRLSESAICLCRRSVRLVCSVVERLLKMRC